MPKEPFGKNRIRLLLAAVSALLSSCLGPITTIPVIDGVDSGAQVPPQWTRFGAYCIADDFILSSSADGIWGLWRTNYTIFKKIRILTPQGSKFGTITIPRYTPTLKEVRVEVVGEKGEKIAIDNNEIRSKYLESGKIVIPHADPGSTLSLRMTFLGESPPPAFEHWFMNPIPVRTGRFLVHTDDHALFSYRLASYGANHRIKEAMLHQYGGATRSWIVNDLEPIDSVPFRPRRSEMEPRVDLRIDPLHDKNGNNVVTWRNMAVLMREYMIDPVMRGSSGAIKKKVEAIIKDIPTERGRAQAIVSWLQYNINCSFAPTTSTLREVLEQGKSDLFRVSILCREMLKDAGIPAQLVLTRSHTFGGFDPQFVSFTSCFEGIVTIRLDGKEYGICPVYTGYPVGAYPPEYFGCRGLNVDKDDTVDLPEPLWKEFLQTTRVTLDFQSDTATQTMRQRFYQLSTWSVRWMLQKRGRADQREMVERILHKKDDRSDLISFETDGLGDNESPVSLIIHFRDNNPPVEMAGKRRYEVSQYLSRSFLNIDSTRRDDIVVPVPMVFRDTLEIKKIPNKQIQTT